LGFYTFAQGRWQRLTEVDSISQAGRVAEGTFNDVPENLAVLRVAGLTYQVAGSLPANGTLHPDARVSIFSPRDYSPVNDGSVQGTPTTPPAGDSFELIPTIVGSGEDTASVVNDILSDDSRRARHIDEVVSIVNEHGLDGIDLEYSSVDPDLSSSFTQFVTALAERLHQGDKRLSLTLPPPSEQRQAYEWELLGQSANIIRILPIADPLTYWETMPRAVSQITQDIDPRKIMLVVSPYSVEGTGDGTRPIGYLQAMVLAAEAAVREPQNPDDIKPGVTVKVVARNLHEEEGASPLRWDDDAAAVSFSLGGTERRRIFIENSYSVAFKLEVVQAYGLGGVAVSDASAQSDIANLWPAINGFVETATVTLSRPNDGTLTPIWDAPDGGDIGAGAGTTATWVPTSAGAQNLLLVVSDGERRFGRKTLIEVKAATVPSPTPIFTFGPTPSPTATPDTTQTPTPTPAGTLSVQVGKRADGDDAGEVYSDPEETSPDSEVTYRVVIDNDSAVEVTIDSIIDDLVPGVECLDSNGDNAVGQTLAPEDGDAEVTSDVGDDSIVCRFKVTMPGPPPNQEIINKVVVTVSDADGNTGTDQDTATVNTKN